MKNPNGYGTVVKLSGNRRKPYVARVTVGFTEDGKQKRKDIGHFHTRKEALTFLAEYNLSPEEYGEQLTFAQVYEKWHDDKFFGDYNLNSEKNYKTSFNQAVQFHNKPFRKIKLDEMQEFCDSLPVRGQQSRFKSLVNQLGEYAVAHDYAGKNYGASLVLKKPNDRKKRETFTDAEIESILADESLPAYVFSVALYTGCRINELLELKKENLHLDEKYFTIVKSKTNAGLRDVPIHNRILPILEMFVRCSPSEWVFTTPNGSRLEYSNWRHSYAHNYLDGKGITGRTTHCTRHTFITRATEYGVNEIYIKMIVGHVSAQSLTERVYTHPKMQTLLAEINKIP